MANNQIIISRIQNRRGLKENLPQPLLPGEIALTVDTGELWIGSDPNQPPYGVRTYSAAIGDIGNAEDIVDTQIVSAKFTTELSEADFEELVTYLTGTPTPAVVLVEDDILWDDLKTIFIAADISVDAANTINNVLDAVEASPLGPGGNDLFDSALSGALGALNDPFEDLDFVLDPVINLTFATGPDTITRSAGSFIVDDFYEGQKVVVSGTASNDGTYTIAAGGLAATVLTLEETLVAEGPILATATMLRGRTDPTSFNTFDAVDGDFQFGSTTVSSNSMQGSNAAILINEINGAGLVTTFGNLQITTSGIGVGTPAFRDMTVTDTDSGFGWSATGTASADSTTDELTFVSGTNIDIDVDVTNDAIRITGTAASNPDTIYSGFTDTPSGDNVATEAVLTASTGSFTDVPSVIFDIDGNSDAIFIEYSLNAGANVSGSNLTAVGNMRAVASNIATSPSQATLVDDQTIIVNESGDPFAANTVICANFEGTDGDTTFTETARSEPAIFFGNAEIDTAQFNFGASSMLFDGTEGASGTAIKFGGAADDWAAYGVDGTTDFTVEAFVRFAALPTNTNYMAIAMYSFTDSTIWYMQVYNNGGTYELRSRHGNAIERIGVITPSINTWYHAAIQVRNGATTPVLDLLWDGNRVATGVANSGVGFTDAFPITVGGYAETATANITRAFNGHIDDFRYTVGTARYGTGATYTVPASPLCAPPAPLSGDVEFQAVHVPGTPSTSATSLQFVAGAPATILYDAGASDFVTDGFTNGQKITINGTASNNGVYIIASVAAGVLTLVTGETLANETVAGTMTGRNQVKLQYINTYTSDVTLRFVTRRWMSYDYIASP